MISVRCNNRALERDLIEKLGRTREARRAAVISASGEIMRAAVKFGPRDTGRYVRGWAIAARHARVASDIQVPAIRPGKWDLRVRQMVDDDLNAAAKRVNYLQGKGWTSGKTYRQAVKNLDYWIEMKRRVQSQVGLIATDVFGAKRKLNVKKGPYGGEGRIIETHAGTAVRLVNKEPHATLVEWRRGVIRKLSRIFEPLGLRRGAASYLAVFEALRPGRISRRAG